MIRLPQIVFLISIIFSINVKGQSLLPGPGHIFNQSFYSQSCPASSGYFCYSSTFSYSHDSIINNVKYHQLIQGANTLAALIREDSTSQKVYIRLPQFTSDTLLYDFSLGIGDTLRGQYNLLEWIPGYVTVSFIDTILVNGVPSKRMTLSGPYTFGVRIIEHVGSLTGPLGMLQSFEQYTVLDCLGLENVNIYPATSGFCEPLQQSEILSLNPDFNVFPNPNNGEFIITGVSNATISIVNLQGEIMRQLHLTDHQTRVDFSGLPPGMYFIYESERNLTRRFVLTNSN